MSFLLWFFAVAGVVTWISIGTGLLDGSSRRRNLLPSAVFLLAAGAIVAVLAQALEWS